MTEVIVVIIWALILIKNLRRGCDMKIYFPL
jgi:hypothetical protein